MRKLWLVAPVLLSASPFAMAADLDSISNLGQSAFRALSEDMAAAVSYKAVAPAEPLGITGFDIGVEATMVELDNTDAYDIACGGCGDDTIIIPKLHAHKGLPMNLDVGLMMASVPSSNIKITGAELRYAFIEGGVAMPAVAARVTYSQLSGVDQLDMDTKGLELTVSKGFAMLTPYAGAGRIWVSSDPSSSTGLDSEDFSQNRFYAGLNFNMGLMNFALEADQTGDTGSVSGKLGFRF